MIPQNALGSRGLCVTMNKGKREQGSKISKETGNLQVAEGRMNTRQANSVQATQELGCGD